MFIKTNLFLSVLCVGSIFAPALVFPKGTTLKGQVVDFYTKTCLFNVKVELIKDTLVLRKTATDRDGNYSFEGVLRGTYSLQFTSGGYLITTIPDIIITGCETDTRNSMLVHRRGSIEIHHTNRRGPAPHISMPEGFFSMSPNEGFTITVKEIDRMPVRDIEDVLRMLPGVF